ncbi:tyrosine-type recombinase/integrase [Haloarcula laminariae]|uniref:tyrosine-type recombinase/integrase n=1 Tax=Haloarcula laminariae TaxID=2961577 RepID=UPI0021C948D1|nr:site-specific integrase [Halomicroarcula laminariae]
MTIEFDSDTRPRRDDESLLEYYLHFRGKELEPSSKRDYRSGWSNLQDFLEAEGYTLSDITKQEALEWCEFLRARDIKESTAEKSVSALSKMVDDLKQTPEVRGGSPFQDALDTDPFSYDDSTNKLEVPLDSLRRAIFDIGHPVTLFAFVVLLKTGLRCSELVNLDERDVNLDRPISEALDAPRPEIRDKPNTLYIDSAICEGDTVNGEVREHGNKPKSYRQIPLDVETVDLFEWYLGLAPNSKSPANPIVKVFGYGKSNTEIGDRMGCHGVWRRIVAVAEEHGWDVDDGGVTPHWCRHWFTTQLRGRIDDGEVPLGSAKEYVQGLRGDTDDSVISTYTQDWDINEDSKSYPEVYRDNIPTLLNDSHEEGEITCPSCGREPPAVTFSAMEPVDGEGVLCNPCAREEYVSI